ARSHGLVPASANPGSAVPEAITEPDRAILEHSAALQRHCLDGRRQPPLRLARVEDAGRAPGAVDGGTQRQADLVDEPGTQECAIRRAAAFEQQALDAELAVQDL